MKIKYYYRIIRTIRKGSGWQTDDFNRKTKKGVESFVIKDKKKYPTAEYELKTMMD